MKKESGGILLQVITTATISLILVGSVTLMLRNQAKKIKINEYIKKRDTVGRRISNFVTLPDVLSASATDLPSGSDVSGSDHYGNYMLRQCLGLEHSTSDTYTSESDDLYSLGTTPSIKSKSCVVIQPTSSTDDENTWYPLLLIPTEAYRENPSTNCTYNDASKWNNDISCFLAGSTWGSSPDQRVGYSFRGEQGPVDKGHTLESHIHFRPHCNEDNTDSSCYTAHKLQFRYQVTHVYDESTLPDCSDAPCEKNSPIQLGPWPKYEDDYIEVTPPEILENQCNPHAKMRFLDEGGIECQCMSPYRQTLVESDGELYYKSNHRGPICELMNPLCGEGERLVGQSLEGVPICERNYEEVVTSNGLEKNTYQFQQEFYSFDSPIYTDASGAAYAADVCSAGEPDDFCSYYSCRYHDNDPEDGILASNERVDGWMNDLEVTCESYFKFNKVDTHDMYPSGSYYEELVWSITENTAAIFLALSENSLWIPKLLTEKSDMTDPGDYSMLGRRELLFPNVGGTFMPDTTEKTLGGKTLNIPYCNAERILGDNAPSDAYLYDHPRCPLVVCKYKMTCEYAASKRSIPTR